MSAMHKYLSQHDCLIDSMHAMLLNKWSISSCIERGGTNFCVITPFNASF